MGFFQDLFGDSSKNSSDNSFIDVSWEGFHFDFSSRIPYRAFFLGFLKWFPLASVSRFLRNLSLYSFRELSKILSRISKEIRFGNPLAFTSKISSLILSGIHKGEGLSKISSNNYSQIFRVLYSIIDSSRDSLRDFFRIPFKISSGILSRIITHTAADIPQGFFVKYLPGILWGISIRISSRFLRDSFYNYSRDCFIDFSKVFF